MLNKRIIPCLDVNDGRVVKGVNFVALRDAGDPVEIARRYDDRVTFDFFGDQLVCHLSEAPTVRSSMSELPMYPRHFGVTFREQRDVDELYQLCQQRNVPLFADVSLRFEGRVEVHQTFVACDPSDNLLEFKHYSDHRMMY